MLMLFKSLLSADIHQTFLKSWLWPPLEQLGKPTPTPAGWPAHPKIMSNSSGGQGPAPFPFPIPAPVIDRPYPDHPALRSARLNPLSIDALLSPYLLEPDFPNEIEKCISPYVTLDRAPCQFGANPPHRPPWYYASSLLCGLLLGRPYVLLSTPQRPPKQLDDEREFPFSRLPPELRLEIWDHYKQNLAHRSSYWDIMSRIFIKALWSGRHPEAGSRYIAAILVLVCGNAIRNSAPPVCGHGTYWHMYEDDIQNLNVRWGWPKVESSFMRTEDLPRENADIEKFWRFWNMIPSLGGYLVATTQHEYVSTEVLEALDVAREKTKKGERDWSTEEVIDKFWCKRWNNEVGKVKEIWTKCGSVPPGNEQIFS